MVESNSKVDLSLCETPPPPPLKVLIIKSYKGRQGRESISEGISKVQFLRMFNACIFKYTDLLSLLSLDTNLSTM